MRRDSWYKATFRHREQAYLRLTAAARCVLHGLEMILAKDGEVTFTAADLAGWIRLDRKSTWNGLHSLAREGYIDPPSGVDQWVVRTLDEPQTNPGRTLNQPQTNPEPTPNQPQTSHNDSANDAGFQDGALREEIPSGESEEIPTGEEKQIPPTPLAGGAASMPPATTEQTGGTTGDQKPRKPRTPRNRVLTAEQQARFDRWYKPCPPYPGYPRQEAVGEAEKAWRTIDPDDALTETMRAAVVRQVASDQWRRGYIPHPATWLRNERWTDTPFEPPESRQTVPPRGGDDRAASRQPAYKPPNSYERDLSGLTPETW